MFSAHNHSLCQPSISCIACMYVYNPLSSELDISIDIYVLFVRYAVVAASSSFAFMFSSIIEFTTAPYAQHSAGYSGTSALYFATASAFSASEFVCFLRFSVGFPSLLLLLSFFCQFLFRFDFNSSKFAQKKKIVEASSL